MMRERGGFFCYACGGPAVQQIRGEGDRPLDWTEDEFEEWMLERTDAEPRYTVAARFARLALPRIVCCDSACGQSTRPPTLDDFREMLRVEREEQLVRDTLSAPLTPGARAALTLPLFAVQVYA